MGLSERKKFFLLQQKKVQDVLTDKGYVIIDVGDPYAYMDILICKRKGDELVLTGVGEIKSRGDFGDDTIKYLEENGSLVVYDKLKHGASASRLFGVPFFLFVNIVSQKVILIWTMTDTKGNFVIDFDVRRTKTKYDADGGEAFRENAYLSLSNCIRINYL